MAPKQTVSQKIAAKLESFGFHPRKATDTAKGLALTVGQLKPGVKVGEKLLARLLTLGVSARKAPELAKGLAPVARAAVQARMKAKLGSAEDTVVKKPKKAKDVAPPPPDAETHIFRLRTDESILPVSQRGAEGVEVGRIMHGLTSTRSYIVFAVKGEDGIIAVRQLGPRYYNVKFYPTMGYWGETAERMRPLGADDFLQREWYERMHFPPEGVQQLLDRLAAEEEARIAGKKHFAVKLAERLVASTWAPLLNAFDALHGRIPSSVTNGGANGGAYKQLGT